MQSKKITDVAIILEGENLSIITTTNNKTFVKIDLFSGAEIDSYRNKLESSNYRDLAHPLNHLPHI